MMKLHLNKTKKCILIFGVALLTFGTGYRLLPYLTGGGTSYAEVELKMEKIRKYQERIQEQEGLEKKKAFMMKRLDKNKEGLLKGETSAIAAVSMQNRLNEIAGQLDIDIKSTRVLTVVPVENTNMLSVPIQITTELTIRQLGKFIYELEESENMIQITNLQLRRKSETPPIRIYTMLKMGGFMVTPKKDS